MTSLNEFKEQALKDPNARKEYDKLKPIPPKLTEIKVALPYIGDCLSVNHYKYRGRYTKRETREWMEQLGWLIKAQHIEDWKLPLHITCDGVFRDKRSQPDLSNLSKVILDAIEEVTNINDREMRWHDGEVNYGEPMLMITIKEG